MFLNTLLALAALAPSATLQDGTLQQVSIEFDSTPLWIELDEFRQRALVSLPEQDRVAVISTVTYDVLQLAFVGQTPRGLAMSLDGEELYVALGASGSVAVVDADDYSVERTIDCATLLDDPRTWDVSEGKPGSLYVSANPGSNGFSYIVEVDLENGDAQQRVASNRIIRAAPEFVESPDLLSLFIGESSFSPNSIYKLDLTQAAAPIVLEDDHGSISGARDIAMSPDGSRMVLSGGQVVSTATLNQLGLLGTGPSGFDRFDGGEFVWATSMPNSFKEFNAFTFQEESSLESECSFGSGFFSQVQAVAVRDGGLGYLALVEESLCGLAVLGPPFVKLDQMVPSRAQYDVQTQEVEIQGSFFGQAPILDVSLDGVSLENSLLNDGTLVVSVPPGLPGPADLTVTNTTGSTVLESAFLRTPALTAMQPAIAIGQTYDLGLSLEAGSTCMLLVGFAGPDLQCPPFGGFLSLDLSLTAQVLTQFSWPFTDLSLGLPIPDDANLVGKTLRLQALVGQLEFGMGAFTNPVDVTFE